MYFRFGSDVRLRLGCRNGFSHERDWLGGCELKGRYAAYALSGSSAHGG
jgi:hypothetical protein